LPQEVAAVEAAVQRHRKARNYRVNVKQNEIVVYERVGPDADNLLVVFKKEGLFDPGMGERLRDELDRHGQFKPVLRFILSDANKRTFCVQRWCYLGSIDDWIDVGPMGTVDQLARQWIPRLGTDAFFEVY
jgi:hypothetical protein